MHVKERCVEDKSNRSSINTLKKKYQKKRAATETVTIDTKEKES